jgi:hypothetical protein
VHQIEEEDWPQINAVERGSGTFFICVDLRLSAA